jgi:hypothetical protein
MGGTIEVTQKLSLVQVKLFDIFTITPEVRSDSAIRDMLKILYVKRCVGNIVKITIKSTKIAQNCKKLIESTETCTSRWHSTDFLLGVSPGEKIRWVSPGDTDSSRFWTILIDRYFHRPQRFAFHVSIDDFNIFLNK